MTELVETAMEIGERIGALTSALRAMTERASRPHPHFESGRDKEVLDHAKRVVNETLEWLYPTPAKH